MKIECPLCHAKNPATSKSCSERAAVLTADPEKKNELQTRTYDTTLTDLTRGTAAAGRHEVIEELGTGGRGKSPWFLIERQKEGNMSQKILRKTVLFGCVLFFGTALLFSQDWPQWRGPNRDGRVRGFEVPKEWPGELTLKWKVELGPGDSTPALVGDRLFVFCRQGEDETILCLDAQSGKELWKDKYKAIVVTGPPSRHPGPRSSPAVAEGKVVTIGVGGVMSCLDAGTGKVLWRKDPFPENVPQFFTGMSPMIIDGMAIGHLGGSEEGAIIAYDLDTGEPEWQWSGEGPDYASPSLLTVEGTRQIVTLAARSVVGIGLSDGKLLWQIPFVPVRMAYNAATPIVDGQTVIYTGARRGIFAVDIVKEGDGFAVREKWSNPEVGVQFNTPVLKDGFLYGLSNQGNFFCLNGRSGETAWLDPAQTDRSGFAAIVDVGSVILALPSNGELIVIQPNAEELTVLARIKVSELGTYAHPVLAGKRIFIKDESVLSLFTFD